MQQSIKKLPADAFRQDDGDDEYEEKRGDIEGRDIDPDALAFIKAKRNVDDLHRAKKLEKKGVH